MKKEYSKHEELADNASDYLENHQIYDLFCSLTKELVLNRPADPIEFLIDKLQYVNTKKIIILGKPGSGKSTVSKSISENFNLVHVRCGDLVRQEIKENDKIHDVVKLGNLVDDELIHKRVIKRLNDDDCKEKGWILEGFPQTKKQCQMLQMSGIIPDKIIILNLPDSIAKQRRENCILDREIKQVYDKHYYISEKLRSKVIDKSIEEYNNGIVQISDILNNQIKYVDTCDYIDKVYEKVVNEIKRVDSTQEYKRPRRTVQPIKDNGIKQI